MLNVVKKWSFCFPLIGGWVVLNGVKVLSLAAILSLQMLPLHSRSLPDHPSGIGVEDGLKLYLERLKDAVIGRDTLTAGEMVVLLDSLAATRPGGDPVLLSDIHYYSGFYHLAFSRNYVRAADSFREALRLRSSADLFDRLYRQSRLNMGIALSEAGRYGEAEQELLALLERVRELDGAESPYIVSVYSSLSYLYLSTRRYSESIEVTTEGVRVAAIYTEELLPGLKINLLTNNGMAYSRQNDYSRALLYYERAYDHALERGEQNTNTFLNLLNSLMVVNNALGNQEAVTRYYRHALAAGPSINIESFLLLQHNYATFMAGRGIDNEALMLTRSNIEMAFSYYMPDSREYTDVLSRHTRLLTDLGAPSDEIESLYSEHLLPYCLNNRNDHVLIRDIYNSYSKFLLREGRLHQALGALQSALFPETFYDPPAEKNPPPGSRMLDRIGLQILADKAVVLRKLYNATGESDMLNRAIETNSFLVSLIETIRIDISEEESRLLLGDSYREVYNSIVADYHTLYRDGGDPVHFEMAFQYAERSKAAGLLVSLRGLRASRFLIPDSLSIAERNTKRELGAVREQITELSATLAPDDNRLVGLRAREFQLASERAALTELFEREYPEYYNAKYNREVASSDDVLRMTGRRGNYINYLVTDTTIYMFVINRSEKAFLALPFCDELRDVMGRFRELLVDPLGSDDMRADLYSYSVAGHKLYNFLFKPALGYLISDRVIISPDNILTYIPFEALLTSDKGTDAALYRALPFMVKEYEISYTYSATMYFEKGGSGRLLRNRVLAIAPEYKDSVTVQDILNPRTAEAREVLADLPYARREASYIVERYGGSLYLGSDALESVYKQRAPHYRILHLAMHTVINDCSPAYSRMVFSSGPDGNEDGLLNSYEIYTVPLKASLVVIPSCNTGEGRMRSGEGVMSLARGFINAGAGSVVMALWEVDDMHSTDVVLLLYDHLIKGTSKSRALQRAKADFIADSHQLQGHPYFWATLVLYGNDSPIFYARLVLPLMLTLPVLIVALVAVLILRARRRAGVASRAIRAGRR